jgi:hypothetical protein
MNTVESFYADDGALSYESRDKTEETRNILFPAFWRFGMQVHIGRNRFKSQTEALLVPHSRSSYAAGDTSDIKVADGFVGFTTMFVYLHSSVSSADRIIQQERDALQILTCAWDGCNERATMSCPCPWCHQVPYCSRENQDLNLL